MSATTAKINQLIINSPYTEPLYHWEYDKESKSFNKASGRRSAGYLVASKDARDFDDDSGIFIEIEIVNRIRPKVKAWREAGYPGATNVTRRLLSHWHDRTARNFPFFFCQLDAIETLIWLKESQEGRRTQNEVKGDGGKFQRLCTKLCTGGGKTIVMAMLIAWTVCNKMRDPRNTDYTRNILIIAPNLTVKKRLQVLRPDNNNSGGSDNYYNHFDIVPVEMQELMSQARVIIHNWQALAWDSAEAIAKRKEVDKRGPLSDGAYARKVLRNFYENWLVINDEAHHAYRVAGSTVASVSGSVTGSAGKNAPRLSKEEKEAQQEATIWIQGLDRIHTVRRIITCYDFSATPFIPGGKASEDRLFSWIVSDFSLSDGIEAGLVKTPRVVVRDNLVPDVETYKSKLYHIYSDDSVKNSLTASASELESLPDLVRQAYVILAADWKEVFEQWQNKDKVDGQDSKTPVMISVANCTATAARIERFFASGDIALPEELCEPDKILRIDSRKLQDETSAEGELLREKVDTVGQEGKAGEHLRNIISVGMLSEGWDARTVTHIMGLRAFSSQLLCEQVVGRGLRRTSYDVLEEGNFFKPEYVNVFGVPFTFLPHEDASTGGNVTHTNTTEIKVLEERSDFRITWPNITRLEYVSGQKLSFDINSVAELELNAELTRINAEIAPVLDGKANLSMCSDIDLEEAYKDFRLQRIIFQTAAKVFDEMEALWKDKAPKLMLLGQVVKLVEEYLHRGGKTAKIKIYPPLFETTEERRKILYAMNMDRIIKNLWSSIRSENTESIIPVYDSFNRTRSTVDMPRWWTTKPNELTQKSHINRCVFDSAWEASEAYCLDRNPNVKAWAKNDHLGFQIFYLHNGEVKRYIPDFLIRLNNATETNNTTDDNRTGDNSIDDKMLILEVKGRFTEQDKVKREALKNWCIAVNSTNEFGKWYCDVSTSPADIDGIIKKYV